MQIKIKKIFFCYLVVFLPILSLAFFLLPNLVFGQELHQDLRGIWKGKVISVQTERENQLSGFNFKEKVQTLKVEILEGPKTGELITAENNFLNFEKGDLLFLSYLITVNGEEFYSVQEPYRLKTILFFVLLFAITVIVFGGMQGLRSLISLAGCFFILFYFLFPSLLAGVSPILASSIFSILILVFAIYVTHGINRESTSALLGTSLTIFGAIFLANFAVKASKLSGFSEDASFYLNLNTGGILNFEGLLLGAIIIGILGVLDDVAITQASAVNELGKAGPHLSRREIYTRALRIGREHIGAVVNTLALAYTGAALPLLLFFYSTQPALIAINREVFSVEIIRTVIGSTAIIFAVPITTLIAVFLIIKGPRNNSQNIEKVRSLE